ncbi:hypothetical protein SKAU_G00060490 [Synaphobranchus kaupii]|uniref:Uncharacterized protein n=1 Tax=Synaphobranchus kaupii TaxID=118154 RepID=A0A9Q1G4S6_SYNKA|nr:hypothetical protein SKAU_G00060490 [Synaphobranchus kaupii]
MRSSATPSPARRQLLFSMAYNIMETLKSLSAQMGPQGAVVDQDGQLLRGVMDSLKILSMEVDQMGFQLQFQKLTHSTLQPWPLKLARSTWPQKSPAVPTSSGP